MNVHASNSLSVERRKVIIASSLGTAFEWYDFHLYGNLAPIIAKHYFSGVTDAAAFVFALLTFAAGFAARPFGSLVFGALGDTFGRKYIFTATIVLMALPTLFVGLLPGYETLGIAAPIILISLRVLQGLASGGEYGGALIFVAEHASRKKRGIDTSWINAMGAVGVVLALVAILIVRSAVGEEAFVDWAWRIPFVASMGLFAISVWIRLNLHESPVFAEMKAAGKTSKRPIRDALGEWKQLRTAILLVGGATAALGVMAYTSQFYSQFFLLRTVKVDAITVNTITMLALMLSLPFYVFFGWLSDRVGRKPVILSAVLLAALTIQPVFRAMTHYGNPALDAAQMSAPVTVHADDAGCSVQFNPASTSHFTSSCDVAKSYLAAQMTSYNNQAIAQGSTAFVTVGDVKIASFEGGGMSRDAFVAREKLFQQELASALKQAGYPASSQVGTASKAILVALLTFMMALYAAIYSPIGAWMTELFPSRIRYTAISLPYNMGAGWFGGFMPATAFAMVAANGNIYFGLWYPIVVLAVSVVIGFLCLPETSGKRFVDGDCPEQQGLTSIPSANRITTELE